MHEYRNVFLFLIEINNMHRTRHILPIPRTCIWRQCGVSWHRHVCRQITRSVDWSSFLWSVADNWLALRLL